MLEITQKNFTTYVLHQFFNGSVLVGQVVVCPYKKRDSVLTKLCCSLPESTKNEAKTFTETSFRLLENLSSYQLTIAHTSSQDLGVFSFLNFTNPKFSKDLQ